MKKCKHEWYVSTPYYMMKAPTCASCGQPMPNFDFSFYESLIDKRNWEKQSDGSYKDVASEKLWKELERLNQKQPSIFQILKDTFF